MPSASLVNLVALLDDAKCHALNVDFWPTGIIYFPIGFENAGASPPHRQRKSESPPYGGLSAL